MIELKYKADHFVTKFVHLAHSEAINAFSIELNETLIRLVKTSENVEKCAFSAA